MTAFVRLFGSRVVVRDETDPSVNLLVLDANEADALARQLRKAAKEQREVAGYRAQLRERGLI